MLKERSLILLFRNIILVFLLFLGACSNLKVDKKVLDTIYIDNIPNVEGMILRNELLQYFPNQSYSDTKYILKVSLTKNKSLYLTDRRGFATKGQIFINMSMSFVRKSDNKVIASLNNRFFDTYTIPSNGIAVKNIEDQTVENLVKFIAKDILLKTYAIINLNQLGQKNKEIITTGTKNNVQKIKDDDQSIAGE